MNAWIVPLHTPYLRMRFYYDSKRTLHRIRPQAVAAMPQKQSCRMRREPKGISGFVMDWWKLGGMCLRDIMILTLYSLDVMGSLDG